MSPSVLLASLIISSAAAIGVDSLTARQATECNDVHLFLARGNNEPYPGRQREMVELICDNVNNCGYEDLIYSALYTDLYCQTVYDGVLAAYNQTSAYACRCPNAKLVLLGYSQGAQVITDFLGGGGGTLFNGCVQPTTIGLNRTTSPGNKVSAAVVFGDTRHTGNQTYNFGGGSAINGVFPRPEDQLQALDVWSTALYAFCGAHDPVCANAQPESNWNVTQHLDYYDNGLDAEQAAGWAKAIAQIPVGSPFTTVLATSISGTAQDYATIPSTFTPSGTVTTGPLITATCS